MRADERFWKLRQVFISQFPHSFAPTPCSYPAPHSTKQVVSDGPTTPERIVVTVLTVEALGIAAGNALKGAQLQHRVVAMRAKRGIVVEHCTHYTIAC